MRFLILLWFFTIKRFRLLSFPDFIVAYENIVKSFGIINNMDLRIKSYNQLFMKRKKFLIIVNYTWKYINKIARPR